MMRVQRALLGAYLVGGHLAVRLDPVLKAVELPAGVTDLHAGLADVDADDFAHCCWCWENKKEL